MILPSRAAVPVTHEVGYLEREADEVARWLGDGLGSSWLVGAAAWESLERAAADLAPAVPLTRYAAVPVGSWTLILSNGPLPGWAGRWRLMTFARRRRRRPLAGTAAAAPPACAHRALAVDAPADGEHHGPPHDAEGGHLHVRWVPARHSGATPHIPGRRA